MSVLGNGQACSHHPRERFVHFIRSGGKEREYQLQEVGIKVETRVVCEHTNSLDPEHRFRQSSGIVTDSTTYLAIQQLLQSLTKAA